MTNARLSLWITALLAAALGTYLLYDAHPGLNWGIWVAATSTGLIAARTVAQKPVRRHTLAILGWASILAFAASVTGVEAHAPIIILTVAILLGLAVTTLDDTTVGITLPSVAQVPFMAATRVLRQSAREIFEVPPNGRGLRTHPALRGILLAIPIVLILVTLLSKADPVLDSVRDTLLGWMDNWVIDGRFVFFVVLSVITLGAYGLATRANPQTSPPLPGATLPFGLKRTDSRIILGSVNAVLWLFVVLQLFAFTRNPGGAAGTGLTYAEYARRGFAELSLAAAVVLGVILFMEVFSRPDPLSGKRRLELAAIFGVELILASAFRRVLLYEAAYGYTTDRVIAQLYMVVIGCAFLLLAWDLSRGAVSAAFGRRGMMLTLAAVTAFTYWNYEAWIVRENVIRASGGAELDVNYLSRLSVAAVPALLEARKTMSAQQQAALDKSLACRRVAASSHWYEWNLRRENAALALRQLKGPCATK